VGSRTGGYKTLPYILRAAGRVVLSLTPSYRLLSTVYRQCSLTPFLSAIYGIRNGMGRCEHCMEEESKCDLLSEPFLSSV